MLIQLHPGQPRPLIDVDFYQFNFSVFNSLEESRVMRCLTLQCELDFFRTPDCLVITQEIGDKEFNILLLTDTLGLQHAFMDCFRALYKTYYNSDFKLSGDTTDWTGSILENTDKNRHN